MERSQIGKDSVHSPAHYATGKIEVIEAIEDWGLSFHCGNVVKYVARAGKKDPNKEIEDLEKAQWYLKRRIELLRAAKEKREPIRPNAMNPRNEVSTSATAASPSKPPAHPKATAKTARIEAREDVTFRVPPEFKNLVDPAGQ